MSDSSRLSPSEADQLTSSVADLAAANLPMADGLRAAAEETNSPRLAHALSCLAQRLDEGRPLNEAIESLENLLPAHVGGLILAAQRTGRFGPVLSELVEHRRAGAELRRAVWGALAYPLFILGLAIFVLVVVQWGVIAPIGETFREYEIKLPSNTIILFWWSRTGVWSLVGAALVIPPALAVIRLSVGAARWRRILFTVPLLGPLIHWSGVAEMARLLAVLLKQQIPLPEALRLCADGVQDADIRQVCHQLSADVERGRSLPAAIADIRRLPAVLLPLVRWGHQTGELEEAFHTAAEMFRARVTLRAMVLRSILPPMTFIVVASIALAVVASVFVPMLSLLMIFANPGPSGLLSANLPLGTVNLAGLLIVGAALLWTVRVAYGQKNVLAGAVSDDALRRTLTTAGWILILSGLCSLVLSLTGPLSILVLMLGSAVALMAVSRYRAGERRMLLWTLACASEKGVPLHVAARAFADQQTDEMAARARRMADHLEQGTSLPWALEHVKNRIPPHLRAAVDLGVQSGALSSALRNTVVEIDENEHTQQTLFEKLFYLGVISLVGAILMLFMFGRYIPAFSSIIEDFNIEPPAITRALIHISQYVEPVMTWWTDSMTKLAGSPLGVAALVLALVLVGAGLHFGLTSVYAGWLSADLMIVGRLTIRYDIAAILRWLAVTVRGQRPLPDAVRTMARRYPKQLVRRRLQKAAQAIEAGEHWCKALQSSRLLRSADAAVLRSAERVGNLDWALDEMADRTMRRLTYRLQMALSIVFPMVLLVFGVCIMLIAVGTFLPLSELIRSLA